MLLDPSPYIDRQYVSPEWVPKEGGCPRHAHYTKGNIRDEK
jgi:hypothetical protein